MFKKLLSVLVSLTIILGLAPSTFAYSESATVTSGATGYTPSHYKNTGSGVYTCRLLSATTNGFTDGNRIYARIRRSSDNSKAGDMATYTSAPQGQYYSYWYGYGDPRDYKIAVNDKYNHTFTAYLLWSPDQIET